ncbi:MAG: hypothetical protein JSS02_08790 [Planctomycetes bacterium]|nr:hypothetical protein [Planctomycetota bacterium]
MLQIGLAHRTRHLARALLCLACLNLVTVSQAAEPRELDHETRVFKVSVDGKERGKCTMEIGSFDDGSEKMEIEAALTFDYKVYVYRYQSKGSEIWRDGHLAELDNAADMNKTKYQLKARNTSKGLLLSVDGKLSELPADVWVTSYWHMPEALVQRLNPDRKSRVVQAGGTKSSGSTKPKVVSLLDSDKGLKLRGEIVRVGNEMLTIAGKRQACDHYKISGDVQVELWYDSTHRLVRQQGVESGHKTLLELTQISK